MSIQKYQEARNSFAWALDIDPTNEGYKASLEQADQKLAETQVKSSISSWDVLLAISHLN